MKKIFLLLSASFLFGCTSSEDLNKTEYPIISSAEEWKKHYEEQNSKQRLKNYLASFEKRVKVIKTPEIIRIIESEPVIFVSTTHSQNINIVLDDGRCFRGVYLAQEAPEKYRKALLYNNILNLSEYIKKQRRRTWETWCE
jgi:hypothetical protein